MEFRLVFKGKIPPETSKPRSDAKRDIRSKLHPQLRELARAHPLLNHRHSHYAAEAYFDEGKNHPEDVLTFWEHLGNCNKVVSLNDHPHRFAPLITPDNYNGCSLDILFLRRDVPGGIVRHGGDIDNRLKTLLDGLRMPREAQEVDDQPQSADENPCFCLFSDDRYIDKISVTTDMLLSPMENSESLHDVELVIHVMASLFDRRFESTPI